jgi:hypothetical protein
MEDKTPLYGWYAYSDWTTHGRIYKDINGKDIYVTCISTSSVMPCSDTKGLMMVGQIDAKTIPSSCRPPTRKTILRQF